MPILNRGARALALGALLALSPSAAFGTPERASKFYDDAVARYERGDAAGAIIQLKNALQQDPKLLAAHALLGKAHLANGDAAAAEDTLEKALQLGVDRSEIAIPLARALAAQGKHRAVLERFPAEAVPPAVAGGVAGAARPIVPRSGGPARGPAGLTRTPGRPTRSTCQPCSR